MLHRSCAAEKAQSAACGRSGRIPKKSLGGRSAVRLGSTAPFLGCRSVYQNAGNTWETNLKAGRSRKFPSFSPHSPLLPSHHRDLLFIIYSDASSFLGAYAQSQCISTPGAVALACCSLSKGLRQPGRRAASAALAPPSSPLHPSAAADSTKTNLRGRQGTHRRPVQSL